MSHSGNVIDAILATKEEERLIAMLLDVMNGGSYVVWDLNSVVVVHQLHMGYKKHNDTSHLIENPRH